MNHQHLAPRARDRAGDSASTKGAQEVIMEFLFKYVSSQRVLTCLPEVGDGTLRATQPSALNDPWHKKRRVVAKVEWHPGEP